MKNNNYLCSISMTIDGLFRLCPTCSTHCVAQSMDVNSDETLSERSHDGGGGAGEHHGEQHYRRHIDGGGRRETCRDFARGLCTRGDNCRFYHPYGGASAKPTDRIEFCRDFLCVTTQSSFSFSVFLFRFSTRFNQTHSLTHSILFFFVLIELLRFVVCDVRQTWQVYAI